MITADDKLREILKIPKKSVKKVSVAQEDISDFDIFIQSTSHNRILLPNTKVLYKTDEEVVEKEATKTKVF